MHLVTRTLLGTAVTGVEHGGDKVVVRTGGETFEGDRAVVTVPLGVLRAGALAFEPVVVGSWRGATLMEDIRCVALVRESAFLGGSNAAGPVVRILKLKDSQLAWNARSRHSSFLPMTK